MDNNIGNRLKEFIEKNYNSQIQFAEVTGINQNVISRYINEKSSPSIEVLYRMKIGGISIDWLIDGTGTMYSDTPNGRKLFAQEINSSVSKEKPYDRIKTWIVENYQTIEKFIIQFNLDHQDLMKMFNENSVLEPRLLAILKAAGCKLEWIVWGEDNSEITGTNFSVSNKIMKADKSQSVNQSDVDVPEGKLNIIPQSKVIPSI